MTLKVIIMNGQLRLAPPTVVFTGGEVTALFPMATFTQPAAGTTPFRPVRTATAVLEPDFMLICKLVAIHYKLADNDIV